MAPDSPPPLPAAASPYLTASLPGIGGRLRARPDHFVVDEIPLREPAGRGEFVRALVEKRRMSTPEYVRRLAHFLEVPPRAVGVAGNKDSDAVTRQWISLPADREAAFSRFHLDAARVLRVERDHEPLRTGELAGNRFAIGISALANADAAAARAREITAVLARRGVPNFFGPQRFGTRGNAARVGLLFLRGERESALHELLGGSPERENDPRARAFRDLCAKRRFAEAAVAAPRGIDLERRLLAALATGVPFAGLWRRISVAELRLFFSAYQSLVFNRIVAARLESIDVALVGDWLIDSATRTLRRYADPAAEPEVPAAVAALTLHPTGLMPGARAPLADGIPGAIERAALAIDPVADDRFDRPLGLTLPGERRPLRVVPRDLAVEADAARGILWLRFALPKGAFATALLGEVQKLAPPPLAAR